MCSQFIQCQSMFLNSNQLLNIGNWDGKIGKVRCLKMASCHLCHLCHPRTWHRRTGFPVSVHGEISQYIEYNHQWTVKYMKFCPYISDGFPIPLIKTNTWVTATCCDFLWWRANPGTVRQYQPSRQFQRAPKWSSCTLAPRGTPARSPCNEFGANLRDKVDTLVYDGAYVYMYVYIYIYAYVYQYMYYYIIIRYVLLYRCVLLYR